MYKQDLTISRTRIKKGDTVKVLLGKDNGKEGKVVLVNTKVGRVMVEGMNIFKRHVKKMQGVEGGIIDLPKSLNISNVAIVCPKCKKATRVGIRVTGTEKIRVCKKCDQPIDKGVTK